MRMHSYGKCNINLAAGALSIFLLVVLYNYWNVSTLNRDLALKIHSLEQQIISFSRANDGLSLNLEQIKDEKTKLQSTLVKEEEEEKASRDLVSQKEKTIRELQNDLDNAKQESQNCREEVTTLESKSQSRDKEIAELKEKLVSLEAQLVEKISYSERIETELSEAKEKLENAQKQPGGSNNNSNNNNGNVKSSTAASARSTAASVGAKPVVAPEEQLQQQPQPVLFNDPAAPPFPNGWMSPDFSRKNHLPKVKVQDTNVGLKGMKYYPGSPIIIFDKPDTPKKKARFSVLDPPKKSSHDYHHRSVREDDGNPFEMQMNPSAIKQDKPEPLGKPLNAEEVDGNKDNNNNNNNEGVGVLQAPGQDNNSNAKNNAPPQQQQAPAPPQGGGNLDAAEDDGDRQMKEDQALQDDQSPDGALPKEVNVNVIPAPAGGKAAEVLAPPLAHSGQDAREDAHLNNNL